MLFWIPVILFSVGLLCFYIYYHVFHELNEAAFCTGVILTGISTACIVMSLLIMSIANVSVDGQIAKMNERYDSLVFQYENDIYDNDNDLGKRELFSDIQNWNEDLSYHKEAQDDFWIGIYIPNIYDQFEFIELNGTKK